MPIVVLLVGLVVLAIVVNVGWWYITNTFEWLAMWPWQGWIALTTAFFACLVLAGRGKDGPSTLLGVAVFSALFLPGVAIGLTQIGDWKDGATEMCQAYREQASFVDGVDGSGMLTGDMLDEERRLEKLCKASLEEA